MVRLPSSLPRRIWIYPDEASKSLEARSLAGSRVAQSAPVADILVKVLRAGNASQQRVLATTLAAVTTRLDPTTRIRIATLAAGVLLAAIPKGV